ncbi:MAG: hypothetical protein IKU07_08745 [Oscillospiraceae bacterium]|nr:hypothetical protein [Oscillospiraceae bacterium]
MPKDGKKINSQQSVTRIVAGIIISIVVSFAAILLVSFLVSGEKLEVATMPIAAVIIHFLSAFLGSVLTGLIFKFISLSDTGIIVSAYSFFYILISVAFFDGIGLRTLWHLIAAAGGGIGAVLLYYSLENKTKKPRKRKRNW